MLHSIPNENGTQYFYLPLSLSLSASQRLCGTSWNIYASYFQVAGLLEGSLCCPLYYRSDTFLPSSQILKNTIIVLGIRHQVFIILDITNWKMGFLC